MSVRIAREGAGDDDLCVTGAGCCTVGCTAVQWLGKLAGWCTVYNKLLYTKQGVLVTIREWSGTHIDRRPQKLDNSIIKRRRMPRLVNTPIDEKRLDYQLTRLC